MLNQNDLVRAVFEATLFFLITAPGNQLRTFYMICYDI